MNAMEEMQYVQAVPAEVICWEAPENIIKYARKSSEEGVPTMIGVHIKNGVSKWCVCCCGQGSYVAYFEDEPNPYDMFPPPLIDKKEKL